MAAGATDLGLVGSLGLQVFDYANAAQHSLMDYAHAIAQCFGVRKNMRGEKDRRSFLVQAQDEFAYLTAASGVESGHGFSEKAYLRIVNDCLRNAQAL